jgi:hypothetical protein
MSVSRTLDRFLAEVRREAKRNPAFAERLDAVFRVHASGRAVDEGLLAEVEAESTQPAEPSVFDAAPEVAPSGLNPHAVFAKDGEGGLRAAVAGLSAAALEALIAEHNLDAAGKAKAGDVMSLTDQIVAAAKRRSERDKKLFDY